MSWSHFMLCYIERKAQFVNMMVPPRDLVAASELSQKWFTNGQVLNQKVLIYHKKTWNPWWTKSCSNQRENQGGFQKHQTFATFSWSGIFLNRNYLYVLAYVLLQCFITLSAPDALSAQQWASLAIYTVPALIQDAASIQKIFLDLYTLVCFFP